MLKRSALPALFVAGSIAGAALLTADDAISGGQAKQSGGKTAEAIVTPVAGPSWLNHLNIKYRGYQSRPWRGPVRSGAYRAAGDSAKCNFLRLGPADRDDRR